jgi:hypothetical protein
MKINRKNFAELFRTDYYTIGVFFEKDYNEEFDVNLGQKAARTINNVKEYTYKVPKSLTLTLGDKLLVCTDNNLDYVRALKVVKVASINREPEIEEDSPFDYKWIVGKLDDVLVGYKEQIEKDNNLKRAVHKLEQALERVSLKKQLEAAMMELGEDDKNELARLFNMPNLLGSDNASTNKKEP